MIGMHTQKARTLIEKHWTRVQNNQSIVILGLLVINTLLLILSFFVHTTRHDVRSVLRQETAHEYGGDANYKRYLDITQSDIYRQQQSFLIEQKHKIFFPEHHTNTLSGNTQ